jgi:hypothetical protein
MFTRTIVDAVVEYVIIAKVEGAIVTERKTQQIEKCSSKEKAELVLSKQNKGALIDLKSISYVRTTYGQEEADFFNTAKVLRTEEINED